MGKLRIFKKITTLNAISGLTLETGLLTVIFVMLLPWIPVTMKLDSNVDVLTLVILSSCGLFSAVPLMLFSFSAKNLPLTAMGFLQFILPGTQLVVALIYYKQPLSLNTAICFSVISGALMIVVLHTVLGHRFSLSYIKHKVLKNGKL